MGGIHTPKPKTLFTTKPAPLLGSLRLFTFSNKKKLDLFGMYQKCYIYLPNNYKHKAMKQLFILIEKTEINNITDFYFRKEMHQFEVDILNTTLKSTIWVLQPNY